MLACVALPLSVSAPSETLASGTLIEIFGQEPDLIWLF